MSEALAGARRATLPGLLGLRLSPLALRRVHAFKANRRGYWSALLFVVLLVASLFAELIANDRPLLVSYEGRLYVPVFVAYPETDFGGFLDTEADYKDPAVRQMIEEKGWLVFPPIPYRYDTIVQGIEHAPSPPTRQNLLGTDNQARDVLARIVYGYRQSVLFGLVLTALSSVIGIAAGALQGYFGGWLDLGLQRFMEVWSSVPTLYLLIILSSFIVPGFWVLLFLMLLFSWMTLVDFVRAECLRVRNFDFVRAARALGVSDRTIILRHVLPNAMASALTFIPFVLNGAIGTLTTLDFLGFGLPASSPSLGELLEQGKNNLQAPWLGLSGFVVVAVLLSLVVFAGEAVRDAFDPRKTLA